VPDSNDPKFSDLLTLLLPSRVQCRAAFIQGQRAMHLGDQLVGRMLVLRSSHGFVCCCFTYYGQQRFYREETFVSIALNVYQT
jgi:hypothetical protein